MIYNELYEKYDLLIPPKFDGGYLIIALYEKIKKEEIAEQFTIFDIKDTLEEISRKHNQQFPQSERILKLLLNYYIRNNITEPGRYYLTEQANRLVEFLKNVLENPYKNLPLKKSFEKSFVIQPAEIKVISDLELKFGRQFIEADKKIITDHLDGLEAELIETYNEINKILYSEESNVTLLIRNFASLFQKFGERADDITSSIASKDKFLKDLENTVDYFYALFEQHNRIENVTENDGLRLNWLKSKEIYADIELFFQSVDLKIDLIRRRIINASDKLNELQEQFSSRSHFRMQIKKLLEISLNNAVLENNEITLPDEFPIKNVVSRNTCFFYPEYYEFENRVPNILIQVPEDTNFRAEEYERANNENLRSIKINKWVEEAKLYLEKNKQIEIEQLLKDIIQKESDILIAYQIVSELEKEVSRDSSIQFETGEKLVKIENTDISLWKTNIKKK